MEGILYLCSECGTVLKEVLASVDGILIPSAVAYCQCSPSTDIYEYTPEEIEELKEYQDEIGTNDLNKRERILFKYLGGINAGKVSSSKTPASVAGDT